MRYIFFTSFLCAFFAHVVCAQSIESTTTINPVVIPNGWSVDWGGNRGNFHCISEVVTADENERGLAAGTNFLRISYSPTPNLFMPQITDAMYPRAIDPNYSAEELFRGTDNQRVRYGFPARTVRISTGITEPLEHGKRYVMTFKYKGNFSGGMAGVGYGVSKAIFVPTKGGRAESGTWIYKHSNNGHDTTLSPSPTWREAKVEFNTFIPDKELRDEPIRGALAISCEFPNTKGELCIADVSLVPR